MHFFQISVAARPIPKPVWKMTLLKKKSRFLIFFLWFFVQSFVPYIIPYGSQTATPPSNHLWIFSNFFSSVVLAKVLLDIFEILSFLFFTIFSAFVNMGLWESKLQALLLPPVTFESFQTFSEFSYQWFSQKYCFNFWNLRLWFLTNFTFTIVSY